MHLFLRLRKAFRRHLLASFASGASRRTTLNHPSCPLVPGGLGQWVVMATRQSATTPYLLLWGFVAVREGTCHTLFREVLRVLGWHLPFRWTDKSTVGNATAVPVSLVKILCSTLCANYVPLTCFFLLSWFSGPALELPMLSTRWPAPLSTGRVRVAGGRLWLWKAETGPRVVLLGLDRNCSWTGW
jgi:hypothetical protein